MSECVCVLNVLTKYIYIYERVEGVEFFLTCGLFIMLDFFISLSLSLHFSCASINFNIIIVTTKKTTTTTTTTKTTNLFDRICVPFFFSSLFFLKNHFIFVYLILTLSVSSKHAVEE